MVNCVVLNDNNAILQTEPFSVEIQRNLINGRSKNDNFTAQPLTESQGRLLNNILSDKTDDIIIKNKTIDIPKPQIVSASAPTHVPMERNPVFP